MRDHKPKASTDKAYRGSSRLSSDNIDSPTGKIHSEHKGPVSHRRRQWGSQSGDRINSTVPIISSDSLEKLVPTLTTGTDKKTHTLSSKSEAPSSDIDPTIASEDPDMTDQHIESEQTVSEALVESPNASPHSGSLNLDKNSVSRESLNGSSTTDQKHNDISTPTSATKVTAHTKSSSGKRKGPKETKAVGYLIEAPERINPFSPAKHRPTNIIYIRSLVRPFTADQLRQMISERFGPVCDLWLDRIKSSSLVRLESVETATRCREGLDGCRWPSMNPHTLHCDFGNDELFKWMQEHGNSGEKSPPKHLVLGEKTPETVEPENTSTRAASSRKRSDGDTKARNDSKPTTHRQEKSDRTDKGSQPAPKEPTVSESKRRCEEPAKLLDDLFRKTTATPCIYWLPLPEDLVSDDDDDETVHCSKNLS
ncbi:unnamed protein product [Echinostoma caproni]|uniref:RRM domain-containing protein n=1 Tax=Echinostoma caproni TaxID=27848 RepID=A0A183AWG4_9TREM|nr:unnamed protein product [Echinostoma caproni]